MFSDSRCKNACICLQICAHVFINRPQQNCAKTSFTRKSVPHLVVRVLKPCPVLCRLRTKSCPNFGRSRARSCPNFFCTLPFSQPSCNTDGGGCFTCFCTRLQAEKRAHHNALERKRRDHIKESFHGLRDSVPALHGEKVAQS